MLKTGGYGIEICFDSDKMLMFRLGQNARSDLHCHFMIDMRSHACAKPTMQIQRAVLHQLAQILVRLPPPLCAGFVLMYEVNAGRP